MKLQNLTVIFIIIILPISLITSLYISTGLKTIEYQARYDTGLIDATSDAINAFEKNTANIKLSDNPEIKRSIINASIKMFERSLSNTCNISSYNTNEIEQYIPAIVFGMYDGFYMYAPSGEKAEYKHNLKSYVYYSETLEGIGKGGSDIVILYSLDNYVTVCGDFDDDSEGYITKSGYLTIYDKDNYKNGVPGSKYRGINIFPENINGYDASKYYWESYVFTEWFNTYVGNKVNYLKIDNQITNTPKNDPENPNSPFVQHKRTVIKNKIEGVLNSSITAYSAKTFRQKYKMPKLTVEDWERIYSNISMITFFQGKKIGFTKYNGYCVLNSVNNNEYVNPNLMYFIEESDDTSHYYHDIRCQEIDKNQIVKKRNNNDYLYLIGYKVGAFKVRKVEQTDDEGNYKTDDKGNTLYKYIYDHKALACYNCVNYPFSINNKSIYEYIWSDAVDSNVRSAYWTSLARERYNSKRVNAAKIRVTSASGTRIGYYNDIDTAMSDCDNGGIIEILEEIKLTKRIGIYKSITIIGKITTTQDIYIGEGATVNMNNVNLVKQRGGTASNVINNNGNLTINNSIITKESNISSEIDGQIVYETVIKNRSVGDGESDPQTSPKLTINNSSITNNTKEATIISDRGSVTINYSKITNDSGIGVIENKDGEVTINSNEEVSAEMVRNNGGNLTINGN